METKFNYLINDSYDNFPEDYDVDARNDPDSCSEELYDHLIKAFFSDELLNKKYGIVTIENRPQRSSYRDSSFYYTLFVNDNRDCDGNDVFYLSSDYIGPSVYWSKEIGKTDKEIVEFLKITRTLGGHILWPRKINGQKIEPRTINQAKGGNYGVYDRMDWTLAMLKFFYSHTEKVMNRSRFTSHCKGFLPKQVRDYTNNTDRFSRMFKSINSSAVWLSKFGNFRNYCDYFKLTGSFVTEDYEVVEFAPFYPFLILPDVYDSYISKICTAISIRNERMVVK